MKNFTCAYDVPNIQDLIITAQFLKENPHAFSEAGKNLTLGLLFMNPSLRTRLSTLKAAQLLGMNTLTVNAQTEGWALDFSDAPMNHTTVEHIHEAAAVLGEYCDILGVRSFPSLTDRDADDREKLLLQWMKYSNRPMLSLESATRHPLQSLADMMTIQQLVPNRKPKVVLTWAPHVKPVPHAVANSFCEWMKFMDAEFVVACPDEVRLNEEFTNEATVTNNQQAALKDADVVMVKSWCSYEEYGKLHNAENWLLTPEKLQHTNHAKVMHCLPVRRDVELSSGILESSSSAVIQQAANRVPAAQSVLYHLIKSNCVKKNSTQQLMEVNS
jgi:N-succinyl-L-ornithine transcarbamylase